MYNQPPFTVAVKADSPIKTPKDFEGKTLGGAANDGALKLFPALCQARQDRLQQGQDHQHPAEPARADADARPGRRRVRLRQHHPLLRQADGRRPDKQMRCINYGDYGMDLYSNAIIVSKKLVKENPKAVRGLRARDQQGRCVDSLKDPDAAVAAVAKREPLIKMQVERERFDATIKDEMNHPEIAKIGLGDVDDGAAEEVDRHPGRRQQPAAHAGGRGDLHAARSCRRSAELPHKLVDVQDGLSCHPGLRVVQACTRVPIHQLPGSDRHGPGTERPRRGDHRTGQGHGRGRDHGVRRGRLQAGAGRPRHRGDRAGRGGGARGAAARRSWCPATSPMRSSASTPPRPRKAAFGAHRHSGQRRRRLRPDRQDRRRDHARGVRRDRHPQHERLLQHHARRAAGHDGAALRQDRQCRRHLRHARPRRPHGLFGLEMGPARHHQELRARGRPLQHQRQLRRARHGRRPALPREGVRRHGEAARHHGRGGDGSATPPTTRSSA